MRFRPFVLFSLLFFGACLNSKDYDLNKITITPNLVLPLASGDLGLIDIVSGTDQSYIKTYSDGLVYFSYQKTLASQGIRQLFTLTDKSYSSGINLPAITLPPSSVDFRSDSIVQSLDLNLSPEVLSEIGLKAGTLDYTISTTPSLPNLSFKINMVLTDIVDQTSQKPLSITSGVGTGLSQSLQNFKINLNQNKFNMRVVLILTKRSNSQFIPPSSKVNIQLTFSGMTSSYIRGFFGDRTVSLPTQSLDLTVFSNSLKKSPATLVQPVIKLLLGNDNGVPSELSFSNIQAKKTGAVLSMQLTPSSPVTMTYPSTLGTSATTPITIGNSSDLINFLPTSLEYTSSVRINKGLSSGNNFLADTSKLRITLAAEIPLYGRASNIVMRDTSKLDLSGASESTITLAKLKIKAVNQLPLDVSIQMYLADQNYVIQDSLLTSNQTSFVKGSTVSGTGELLTASTADSQLDLTPAKVNKLFTTKYLIIKAKLNTSKDASGSQLNVKFKSSYKLNLSVGLNVQLKLTTQ